MGDLPDWTQATSNAGTVLNNAVLPIGQQLVIDVSNNDSLVINAVGTTTNTPVAISTQWFTATSGGASVTFQDFSAVPSVAGNSFLGVETPVYASALFINNNSGQAINLVIIGSSRTVTAPRVLGDAYPSRRFAASTNMVSGTQYLMARTDTGPTAYNANAQATLTAQSNTAGNLYVRYVNSSTSISLTPVMAIVAAGFTQATIALPQGAVDFVFIPTANNAAGSITLDIAPGQL